MRPSWPSLKMMTPAAPASKAFCALTEKSHVPRCTSAMLPAVKSAKSSGSHPLVDVLASAPGGSTRSTACSGCRDVAAARVLGGEEVLTGHVDGRIRRDLLEHGLRQLAERVEQELLDRHLVAGRLEQPGDVVDRGVVPRRAARARAAVRVGDRLELGQVVHDRVGRSPPLATRSCRSARRRWPVWRSVASADQRRGGHHPDPDLSVFSSRCSPCDSAEPGAVTSRRSCRYGAPPRPRPLSPSRTRRSTPLPIGMGVSCGHPLA